MCDCQVTPLPFCNFELLSYYTDPCPSVRIVMFCCALLHHDESRFVHVHGISAHIISKLVFDLHRCFISEECKRSGPPASSSSLLLFTAKKVKFDCKHCIRPVTARSRNSQRNFNQRRYSKWSGKHTIDRIKSIGAFSCSISFIEIDILGVKPGSTLYPLQKYRSPF